MLCRRYAFKILVKILALTLQFGVFDIGSVSINFTGSEEPHSLRSSPDKWSYCRLVLRIGIGERAVLL